MDPLRLSFRASEFHLHPRAPKKVLELVSLVGLQHRDVRDSFPAKPLPQPVQANPCRTIGDAELVGDLAQRHMAANPYEHRDLVAGHHFDNSLRHSRYRRARSMTPIHIAGVGRGQPVCRVALGDDALTGPDELMEGSFSRGEATMQIAVTVARAIA